MNYTLNQVMVFSGIVWTVFLTLTTVFLPTSIFHIINPLAIAIGVVLIIVYGEGLLDAWRYRKQGVTPAHLLTIGVVLNWTGMIIRMARWYVTGQHPSVLFDLDFWFYNLGLWMSIWGGLFLIGAAGVVAKPYRFSTLLVIFILIVVALTFTDYAGMHWREMQHHGLVQPPD